MTNIDHNKNDGPHKTITYRRYKNFNPETFLLDSQNTAWLTLYAENITTDQYL